MRAAWMPRGSSRRSASSKGESTPLKWPCRRWPSSSWSVGPLQRRSDEVNVLRPGGLDALFRRELGVGPGVARSGHLRALDAALGQVRQRAIHRELVVRRGAAERIDRRGRGLLGDVRQGAVEVELLERLAVVVREGRGGEYSERQRGDKAFHKRVPFSLGCLRRKWIPPIRGRKFLRFSNPLESTSCTSLGFRSS